MQLNLKQFDMSSIGDDKIVVFIGMRGAGKSILVKDHLYHHRDIPIGTVISPTERENSFYSNFIPDNCIHDNIDGNIIADVLKRQKQIIRDKNNSSNIDPRAFLVIDDCLYDKKWIKDENILCLFLNNIHLKLSLIVTLQHPIGLPPIIRNNIDYIFIDREIDIKYRRRIYEDYGGMFPKFETFCSVMDQCNENYECLVIHNTPRSNKLEDQVYWYKANINEDFKIVCGVPDPSDSK